MCSHILSLSGETKARSKETLRVIQKNPGEKLQVACGDFAEISLSFVLARSNVV
jgi:hypothetical protein